MSQVSTGLRSVLSSPKIYSAFQRLVGSPHARSVVVEEFLRPSRGERILDIGCGPGDILGLLPPVDYMGFDPNPDYIDSAMRRHGEDGKFFAAGVQDVDPEQIGTFDRIMANGVLHHVDDAIARDLFELSARVVREGGRLVAMDPAYIDDQSAVARAIISRDRGQAVRTPDEYVALASQTFGNVTFTIRHDLFRIPYTLVILVCEDPIRP